MLDNKALAAGGTVLLLIISAIFISGAVGGDSDRFLPYPEQASTDNKDINMSEGRMEGLLGFLPDFSIPYLSSVSAPDQITSGDTVTFDVSAEAQQDFNLGGKLKVVEIYDCHDSSCDNGEFVEAKSSYTGFDVGISQGTDYSWTVDYRTPSSGEGYYAATGYMSDGNGNVLTDTPRHVFLVGSSSTDGGDGSSSDGDSDGSDSGSGSETNSPPQIESIDAPVVVNTSETFRISVEASDTDSTGLTYSWSNGKEGRSIILSYEETGVKQLEVEVSDGEETVASTVRVKVEQPEEVVVDPKPSNPITQFWNWFTGLFN